MWEPQALARSAVRHGRVLPWWAFACGGVWLVLLVAWLPVAYTLVPAGRSDLDHAGLVVLARVLGALLLWTVLWGGLLGFLRAWSLVALSAPAGTAVLMACYVFAMLRSAPPQGSGAADNDNAAGAGLIILGVPTLVILSLLLATGAGVGRLLRHVSTRP